MTTTSQKIADSLFLFGMGLTVLIVGFMLIRTRVGQTSFHYDTFQQVIHTSPETPQNLALIEQAAWLFNSLLSLPLDEINSRYTALVPHFPAQSAHVVSSYAQVRHMATLALAKAQQTFNTDNVQIVNAVYTTNSGFSALMRQPQPYLFFATTADKSAMLAIEVQPTADAHQTRLLWDAEQSTNLLETQQAVQKLLVVFNEIKR